jgi:hypothetical protein
MFRRNLRYWYEVAICVVILVIILIISWFIASGINTAAS